MESSELEFGGEWEGWGGHDHGMEAARESHDNGGNSGRFSPSLGESALFQEYAFAVCASTRKNGLKSTI